MPQVQIIEPTIKPQEQKIRVCAYARVSSDSDDQLNSFSAQVEYFTRLIQSHSDWEFVDIYADEGITGTRADKRDEFQRLMRDCRAGRVDRILVKSISRFGRNSTDDGLTAFWSSPCLDLPATALTALKLFENYRRLESL